MIKLIVQDKNTGEKYVDSIHVTQYNWLIRRNELIKAGFSKRQITAEGEENETSDN